MSEITVKPDNFVPTRWRLAAIAIALVVSGAMTGTSRAQCVERSERVPQIVLDAFAAEPASLLRQLRSEKEKLSGRLSGYLVTDISALRSVPALVRNATQADRAAIGAALRQAEMRCRASKPDAARKIGDFVGKSSDSAVRSGYSAEPDDPPPPLMARAPANSRSSAGLMSGEWKTDVADPFAPMPLPQ
jgi:hypothetical protein